MLYALFLGFNVAPDFIWLLIIIGTTSITSMIPITLEGLGIREGSFVILSEKIEIPMPLALSAVLISTTIRYIALIIIAYAVFSKKIKS